MKICYFYAAALGILLAPAQVKGIQWKPVGVLTQSSAGSTQGFSVALSADGNTLGAGAPSYESNGATQIYVRSGQGWQFQALVSLNLTASNEGFSVALSRNGSLLAVGVPQVLGIGYTFVYSRSGNSWKVTKWHNNSASGSREGASVALSADGTITADGAPGRNKNSGAANVFMAGSSSMLSEEDTQGEEGASIALSADGYTLAVGAPGYGVNNNFGAVHIYTREPYSTKWDLQATLTQKNAQAKEGSAVSISADGNTLVATAPGLGFGSTHVYTRSGTAWTHEVTLTQAINGSAEGSSVALSSNGTLLAVGAFNFTGSIGNCGATQIYVRSGESWKHETTLTANALSSNEGYSVALSTGLEDGKALLAAGAPLYADSEGVIFLYQQE